MNREIQKEKRKKPEVAYQNKDILSKILAENFKNKSLRVYGLNVPRIERIVPTNLPAIQVNEMRLDNLFLLVDGSLALIDYESEAKWSNQLKYANYVVRVLERYAKEEMPRKIRMIVIYTADVLTAPTEFSAGCLTLKMECAFLRKLDAEGTEHQIREKIANGRALSEEEQLKLIVLPLAYKGKARKKRAVKDAVGLAKQIKDTTVKTFVLSGILVFADKIIDAETADYIRRVMSMTKVEQLIWDEAREKYEKASWTAGRIEGEKTGREEGIALSGAIFQMVRKHPGITNDKVAASVGCEVEQVESVRKMFQI